MKHMLFFPFMVHVILIQLMHFGSNLRKSTQYAKSWLSTVIISVESMIVPHGGVLVGGEQAVAGLHASNSHCPLSWLAGHKHWLLVRLLWHRNLLQK